MIILNIDDKNIEKIYLREFNSDKDKFLDFRKKVQLNL